MLYIHTYVIYMYIYIYTCITYTIDKSLTLKIDSHDRNLFYKTSVPKIYAFRPSIGKCVRGNANEKFQAIT